MGKFGKHRSLVYYMVEHAATSTEEQEELAAERWNALPVEDLVAALDVILASFQDEEEGRSLLRDVQEAFNFVENDYAAQAWRAGTLALMFCSVLPEKHFNTLFNPVKGLKADEDGD